MTIQVTHTVTQSPTSSTYIGMDVSKLDNIPWGYVDLEGIIGECSLNDERSKARRDSRRRSRPTRKLLEERGGSAGGSSGALTASTSTMEDLSSHSPGGHNDETPNYTTSGTPHGRRIVLEASRECSPGAFALLRRNLGSNDISEPMNKIESSSPRRGGKIPQTCRGSGPMVIQASPRSAKSPRRSRSPKKPRFQPLFMQKGAKKGAITENAECNNNRKGSAEISCDKSDGRFRARSPGICRPKMAKSSSERSLGRRPTRSRSPGIFRRRNNEAVEEDTAYDSKTEIGSPSATTFKKPSSLHNLRTKMAKSSSERNLGRRPTRSRSPGIFRCRNNEAVEEDTVYDSKTEIGSPSATTPKKPSSLHNLRSPGRFLRALSNRRLQCFEQAH
jgi:hypothetical protein